MARKMRPLGERVVIERVEANSKTSGGILLPDNAKEKPIRGIVKAIGPGRALEDGSRQTMQVKLGNEVFFTSYAGTEVEIDGKKNIIMNESDILAIIE